MDDDDDEAPFPANDSQLVGHDLIKLIVHHLRRRGLHVSARTLADEAQVLPIAHKVCQASRVLPPARGMPLTTHTHTHARARAREQAILRKTADAVAEGDWEALREIAKGVPSRLRKSAPSLPFIKTTS